MELKQAVQKTNKYNMPTRLYIFRTFFPYKYGDKNVKNNTPFKKLDVYLLSSPDFYSYYRYILNSSITGNVSKNKFSSFSI